MDGGIVLATYLPFDRVHELGLYFAENVRRLSPDKAYAFVDGADSPEKLRLLAQEEIKIMPGSWGGRGMTWVSIFRMMQRDGSAWVVVDSDNVLDPELRGAVGLGEPVLGVMDWDDWRSGRSANLYRSRRAGDLDLMGSRRPSFYARVHSGSLLERGPTFFIGPKQALIFTRPPEPRALEGVAWALHSMGRALMRHLSDETVLGVLAYLSGIREVRWTVGSTHFYRQRDQIVNRKHLEIMRAANALAHETFAKLLYRRFGMREFRWYMIKYMLARHRHLLASALP